MARSTPIVLSAGAIVIGHGLVVDRTPPSDLAFTAVAVALAAIASAGLDAIVPGFGTGLAALLLTGAILAYLAPLLTKIQSERGK